jgi:hypothetical protein
MTMGWHFSEHEMPSVDEHGEAGAGAAGGGCG